MEMFLFYSYLKYRKDSQKKSDAFKKILKLPKFAICTLIALILSALAGGVFAFLFQGSYIVYIPLSIEFVSALIMYFYISRDQIKMSDENIANYKDRCVKNFDWLKSNSVSEKKQIQEYHSRLVIRIEKSEKANSDRKRRVDRWMQVILVPVFLSVFSSVIQDQVELQVVVGLTLTVALLLVIVYVLVLGIFGMAQMFANMELNKIQMFADDLQGILDTQFNIEKGKS